MNNLKKALLTIVILVIINCPNSNSKETFSRPRYAMELLDGDNSDLYGCALLIKMTPWEKNKNWNSWSRGISLRWNDGITQTETGLGLYLDEDSVSIQKDPKYSLIYVGKWHHVKRINKDIRLIGYQNVDKTPARFGFGSSVGKIHHQFEEKTEENQKIKEMKFKFAVIPQNHHKQDSECAVKWYDKYGYNAIIETKRVWHPDLWGKLFLQRQLEVTGKVIQAEE